VRPSGTQKFQVGDLVVAAENYPQGNCSIRKGDEGVVCDIDEETGMIGVDWGFSVHGGHSCSGHCQYAYGWYVATREIKLSDAGQDINEDSFLQIIGGIK